MANPPSFSRQQWVTLRSIRPTITDAVFDRGQHVIDGERIALAIAAPSLQRGTMVRLSPSQIPRHWRGIRTSIVTVSVKVPEHYRPVMAAIAAGRHVYSEWPLGRNTDEAVRMLDAAKRRGGRHARDPIVDGYVGRVLTATMFRGRGCGVH